MIGTGRSQSRTVRCSLSFLNATSVGKSMGMSPSKTSSPSREIYGRLTMTQANPRNDFSHCQADDFNRGQRSFPIRIKLDQIKTSRAVDECCRAHRQRHSTVEITGRALEEIIQNSPMGKTVLRRLRQPRRGRTDEPFGVSRPAATLLMLSYKPAVSCFLHSLHVFQSWESGATFTSV